ncbi:grpE protein homolog 1, mitochondrial-like [Diadema antillarum]|uniref:grpE protein homolog 1, mitochondrial-like n=1 Tax=Diadema antillarum TaxID=105358 RepID=UPI003A87B9BF
MAATMVSRLQRIRLCSVQFSNLNTTLGRRLSCSSKLLVETKEASSADPKDRAAEEPKLSEAEQKLIEEKEKLVAQVADYTDKYKRALAETENVRMRFTKQLGDAKLYAISGFCKDLLEVADILGKATSSVPQEAIDGPDANIHLKGLFKGLQMTETQLQKVFSKHNLTLINPINNEPFDPNLHEALFELPVPDKEPGSVAVVSKVGYKLHERTLRPALVGVAKAP